jgi:hypothetical protein
MVRNEAEGLLEAWASSDAARASSLSNSTTSHNDSADQDSPGTMFHAGNDYDAFLLHSIPNLVYPEAGLTDGIFDDVSLFDGFNLGM